MPCASLGEGAHSLKVAAGGQHKLALGAWNEVAARGFFCLRRRFVGDIGAVTTDRDFTVVHRGRNAWAMGVRSKLLAARGKYSVGVIGQSRRHNEAERQCGQSDYTQR